MLHEGCGVGLPFAPYGVTTLDTVLERLEAADFPFHRGAAISREWELVLSPSRDKAAAIDAEAPFAEYAPTSFWLARPPHAAEAEPPGSRPFLLIPLNEMQDEHYNVYWCKPGTAAEALKTLRHCIG